METAVCGHPRVPSKEAFISARRDLFFFSRFVKNMPLPLTIGLIALRAARQVHTTPAVQRPRLLKKVFYARMAGYGMFAGVVYGQHKEEERRSST